MNRNHGLLFTFAMFIFATLIIAGTLACASNPLKNGPRSGAAHWFGKKQARIPLILDTDIGDDIDDTWALAMLLGARNVDLRLIVTGTNDTAAKTRLTAKLLEQMGRTDVPIGTGPKTSSALNNQMKWLGNFSLDRYPGKVQADGVQALIDCVHASKTPLTICAIGPVTNLAEALRRDPSIAKKARLVCMAGSVYVGYAGKQGRDAEYNVACNVAASRAVLAAPWLSVTWAPLDSCGNFRIKGERFARLAASQAPLAAAVLTNYAQWAGRSQYPAGESSILFDTVAAYLCLDEKYCEMKTVNLRIDDKGFSVPDAQGRPVRCALALKDQPALEQFIENLLTRP